MYLSAFTVAILVTETEDMQHVVALSVKIKPPPPDVQYFSVFPRELGPGRDRIP